MRVRLPFSVFLSLLLLLTLCSSSLGQAASPDRKPPKLTTLPESVLNAELKSARGGPFKLSDYSGQVLVINLWATWVPPSRLEVPNLVKLQNDLWSQGVRIVGLSTENPTNSVSEVREFVRAYRIQYKIGWATPDISTILMQGRDALPQTYVISRSGKIIKRFVGFNSQVTPSLVKEAVAEALDEKPDTPEEK